MVQEKCTFSKKLGGACSLDKRYKETNVVPLLSCERNVTEHTRGVGITEDIDTEYELILARASIFVSPRDISTWQIRPAHRSRLGIGSRGRANRCRVPAVMSSHGERKRIADRESANLSPRKYCDTQEYFFLLAPVCILMYNILYHYHRFVGPLAFYIAQLLCPLVFITSKTQHEVNRAACLCD